LVFPKNAWDFEIALGETSAGNASETSARVLLTDVTIAVVEPELAGEGELRSAKDEDRHLHKRGEAIAATFSASPIVLNGETRGGGSFPRQGLILFRFSINELITL